MRGAAGQVTPEQGHGWNRASGRPWWCGYGWRLDESGWSCWSEWRERIEWREQHEYERVCFIKLPRTQYKPPVVPSTKDVNALLNAIERPRYQALAMVMYGTE
ncbi:MAG TPA: hypothetical protein VKP30_02045, partial [Polyangiaceae bacterium]|nr:hypothetical protein [Polyangiaceae bacterium]